jgi:hypothetical protein
MVNPRRHDQLLRLYAPVVVLLVYPLCDLAAEPVGSPASILKKGQWAMGLGGGAVLDRELDGSAKALVYHGGHFRGYGLTDRLSLYGKLGLAYLEVDDASIKKTKSSSTQNSFGRNLLSSVQLKGRLWQNAKKTWEWDGSLQYVDIRARHKGKNEARWHEWQFATSVAKSFGRVKPYAGAKYSMLNVKYRVRENASLIKQDTYEEDNPLGFFLGTDCYFGEHEDVIVNVETAFVDGVEITLAVLYVF